MTTKADKLKAKAIFEAVVMELRDWRGIRYTFDAFSSEDEEQFESCLMEAIITGLAEGREVRD